MKRGNSPLAIVSGAASGLGLALAKQLSQAGYRLALNDINTAGLKQVEKTLPNVVHSSVVDVSDQAAIQQFAAEIIEQHGIPHLVINNAGVLCQSPLLEMSLDDFRWVMDINFWGMVYASQAFVPVMVTAGRGCIVNVSSMMGYTALPNSGAYTTSKFAINGYTQTLRQELEGTGVKAVIVHPGAIRTNLSQTMRFTRSFDGSTDRNKLARQIDKAAQLSPEQVATAILKGVRKKRSRIIVGIDARLADWLTRLLPSRYDIVALAMVKRFLSTGEDA